MSIFHRGLLGLASRELDGERDGERDVGDGFPSPFHAGAFLGSQVRPRRQTGCSSVGGEGALGLAATGRERRGLARGEAVKGEREGEAAERGVTERFCEAAGGDQSMLGVGECSIPAAADSLRIDPSTMRPRVGEAPFGCQAPFGHPAMRRGLGDGPMGEAVGAAEPTEHGEATDAELPLRARRMDDGPRLMAAAAARTAATGSAITAPIGDVPSQRGCEGLLPMAHAESRMARSFASADA